jgi:uncharacterized protein YndB with AHSA1/START domain
VTDTQQLPTDDDRVFKALADPTRRYLLDGLFFHDGRSLSELTLDLKMSRFGVMKHLRLLEEAGLVVSRRSGRKRLHFLNPVPIRLIHDRWIDKYTEAFAMALSDLKYELEHQMEKIYEIYIRTTPERLWEAITKPEIRAKYTFGIRVDSDWTVGSRLVLNAPKSGQIIGEGEVLELDPPRRLVHSMVALWNEEVKSEGPSRITWQIEPVGDSCRLVVTHDELREGANEELFGGWPMIVSGLKTWLETGELLTTPGSLIHS